ncbi:hypothetical protein X798_02370 [Onchocerca flexuosa]|uniref:Ovule protein n=2 Tax=Onchocerca flexuosa TaxID=387005 RepID=A0A183HGI0_9BILA|nr:hypothetical protein X798_02370 [Onchocerca flexuosa]VDO47026.1 unnamed protein product [Onchocerca flexuosa]
MLASIITKDMNPFPSQPRKAREIRQLSQSLDVSKIIKSAKLSCKHCNIEESDKVHSSCATFPTTSDSTLVMVTTTTTKVAPISAYTPFLDSSLSSTAGKVRSTIKKI